MRGGGDTPVQTRVYLRSFDEITAKLVVDAQGRIIVTTYGEGANLTPEEIESNMSGCLDNSNYMAIPGANWSFRESFVDVGLYGGTRLVDFLTAHDYVCCNDSEFGSGGYCVLSDGTRLEQTNNSSNPLTIEDYPG